MKPTTRSSILARIRAVTAAEDGFALVAVMGVMIVVLGLSSAAALTAISTIRGASRDSESKSALAAADAGASLALARQNTIAATGANPCLASGAGGVLYPSGAASDGWCSPVTGSVNGETYSYRTRPSSDGTLEVVSTGDASDVNRRIELTAVNSSGAGIFSEAGLIGRDSLQLDSNTDTFTPVASNGDITMSGTALLCGAAQVGIGRSLIKKTQQADHGGPECAQSTYPVSQNQLSLPAVQQGDVVTNNSNGRFFGQDLKSGRVEWDASSRRLELKAGGDLTLGGSNYSLCTLKLGSRSNLFIADGATVRIFFDSPEACGLEDGDRQLDLGSNSAIDVTSTKPVHLALLFVGSDEISTTVELNSNSTTATTSCINDFVVYAPKSYVDMDSNVTFCGAIAGKDVNVDSNTTFRSSAEVANFQLPGAGPHFVADRFVECSAKTTVVPDAEC